MKFFIVLLAVVAAASAGHIGILGGYGGHAETYHVEAPGAGSAAQPHIPGPHAKPVSYKGNDHVTRIHWSGGHAAHPHLVGVEHYVAAPEPAISVVKTGHGW